MDSGDVDDKRWVEVRSRSCLVVAFVEAGVGGKSRCSLFRVDALWLPELRYGSADSDVF